MSIILLSKKRMKKLSKTIIVLFFVFGITGPAFPRNDPRRCIRNSVLIGWDGVQRARLEQALSDGKLPNLKKLTVEGGFVLTEITTGRTVTKPGWAEILTGYNSPRLQVYDNYDYKPIPAGYTIFERLKAHFGKKKIAAIFIAGKGHNLGSRGGHEICINCIRTVPGAYAGTYESTIWWDKERYKGPAQTGGRPNVWVFREGEPYFNARRSIDFYSIDLGYADNVGAQALLSLVKYGKGPFFAFFHFTDPDERGHEYGDNSPEYAKSLEVVDAWLGKIVEKLKNLELYDKTTIYVTTDHGMNGRQHENSPLTFLATNNKKRIRQGDRKDIAPSILDDYGIDLNKINPPLDGTSLFITLSRKTNETTKK